ncbi:hypothetical protein Tsubulata_048067 [Turnera subulata]|uniref:RRM domain-containing protein n=1 Tax=Turnera subulata TaxID=218843 RepID=A0A9Q0F0U0_9ROSI|nr:hypothetical protein Tsubulata_048067 [Turnera subulata]
MSATATPTFLSTAESSCLFSFPSILSSKPPHQQHHLLPFPQRPIRLPHLSYSLSLKPKLRFPLTKPFVAQTSDWAQQQDEGEDGNPTATLTESEGEEEPTWENDESGGFDAKASDFEAEGGDASAAADAGSEGEGSEDGGFDGAGGFSQPSEEAKIFVGNLPYDVDSEKLAMLFEQAGTVEIAEVIYNRETDTSRGFGFVTMSTVEEAETAVEKLNNYDWDGRSLTVNKAAPRGARPARTFQPAFKVFVGNLPWDFDDARLEQIFSEHGKVVNARVISDRESGRSRGFGFVSMSSENELNDAIAALDGKTIDGRAIRVNVAENRPRRREF